MHELGITRHIVALCAEHAQGATVRRVRVQIGQLSVVMPDAVRFCFEVCARGTPLEGAALEIVEVPGRGRCRACGDELALAEPFGCCPCGSVDLELVAGEELMVQEMEVAH